MIVNLRLSAGMIKFVEEIERIKVVCGQSYLDKCIILSKGSALNIQDWHKRAGYDEQKLNDAIEQAER